jgi:agmatine/peptidylarginine deiminase
MGLFYTLPSGEAGEHDLQIRFDNQAGLEMREPFLPSEWHRQSGVQLTWPHAETDWAYMLSEVEECFVNLAREIARRELLIIATPHVEEVRSRLASEGICMANVQLFDCPTNDTWARDHGAITMIEEGQPVLLDFTFNGWGLKFASDKDNQITRRLVEAGALNGRYSNHLGFVLEGGSIESDGAGTLLTTSECLLSPNRNAQMNRQDIEEYLKRTFHLQQVLWLDHGYLAGDDTDSHVDTLARLCPADTIVYVECNDREDEHYEALQAMKQQLATFRTLGGKPYRLLPLPMADCIIEDGERLPATYANFFIMNEAVLYPTYAQPANDRRAAEVLQEAFPGYEIVGVDCRALIKQHGSLHCVTMQYPVGVLRTPKSKE